MDVTLIFTHTAPPLNTDYLSVLFADSHAAPRACLPAMGALRTLEELRITGTTGFGWLRTIDDGGHSRWRTWISILWDTH